MQISEKRCTNVKLEEAVKIFKNQIRISSLIEQENDIHEKIFDHYFDNLENEEVLGKKIIAEELEKILSGIETIKKSLKDFSSN
jgi:hypothetical protein